MNKTITKSIAEWRKAMLPHQVRLVFPAPQRNFSAAVLYALIDDGLARLLAAHIASKMAKESNENNVKP